MGDEEEVKKRTKKAKDPEKSKKHRSTKKDKEAGEKSKKRASRREKKIDTGDTVDDKKKKRGSRRERKTKLKTEDVSEKEPTKPTTDDSEKKDIEEKNIEKVESVTEKEKKEETSLPVEDTKQVDDESKSEETTPTQEVQKTSGSRGSRARSTLQRRRLAHQTQDIVSQLLAEAEGNSPKPSRQVENVKNIFPQENVVASTPPVVDEKNDDDDDDDEEDDDEDDDDFDEDDDDEDEDEDGNFFDTPNSKDKSKDDVTTKSKKNSKISNEKKEKDEGEVDKKEDKKEKDDDKKKKGKDKKNDKKNDDKPISSKDEDNKNDSSKNEKSLKKDDKDNTAKKIVDNKNNESSLLLNNSPTRQRSATVQRTRRATIVEVPEFRDITKITETPIEERKPSSPRNWNKAVASKLKPSLSMMSITSRKSGKKAKDRSNEMVELLFNRIKKENDGQLMEPYSSAKIAYDSGKTIEEIDAIFVQYDATKHIVIASGMNDDDDEDDTVNENIEHSEPDIEEEDLPEDEFTKEPGKVIEYNDKWTEANAGGCFNYASWRNNPQYLLYVEKTSQIEITLSQPKSSQLLHIGFYIFYGNKEEKRVIAKEELIDKCPLDEELNVSKVIKLAGSTTPYMIVPCTFDPQELSSFTIKVSVLNENGSDIKFKRLLKKNDWKKHIIKGKWRKSNAGGCRNYLTHLLNDQFLISSTKGRISGRLILQYRHNENIDEIGIYSLSAPNDLSHKVVNIFDAPLVSKSGFSLPNEALLDFRIDEPNERLLIIPCTFEPEKYATYRLIVLTDGPITIKSLDSPKYLEIEGEWKGESAVGCINHPSWRYNPQYSLKTNGNVQIQLQKIKENDDTVIGFYVLKSSGSRQLEVNKDNFITKASFMDSQSVTAQLNCTEESTFTIVPCTFRPNNETQFSLRAFTNNNTSILELNEASDDWQETVVNGKWSKGTAGGCINYASWRNNPQIRMIPEEDGEIVLILEQDLSSENSNPMSIGFYVISKPSDNERIWNMEPSDIIQKAAFRKNTVNLCRMNVKKGMEYNIIPCAFSPWDEGSFKFHAYGFKQKIILKRLHRTKQDRRLRVKGKWDENSAGGCMANTSWPKNPHLLLDVRDKPVQMEIMLQTSTSKNEDPPAIGFCITKSDENGFPSITSVDDILFKVNYEEATDISMSVVLQPSDIPYVVTPSTFHPGVKCRFALQVFADNNATVTLSDVHHNFESGEDDFEVIDSDTVEPSPSILRSGSERIEEIVEEEDMAEQIKETATVNNIQSKKQISETSIESSQLDIQTKESEKVITTPESDKAISNTKDENTVEQKPPPPPPDAPLPPPVPVPSAPKLPKPTQKSTKQVVSTPTTSTGGSLFDQIKKGTTLRTPTPVTKKEPDFSFTPFNVDKIVARRAALEFSDDEGSADEWDDDWDDDDL